MQEKNISPSGKLQWKPGTLIYPLPALMVSCGENEAEYATDKDSKINL